MASPRYHLRQAIGCLRQAPGAAVVAAVTVGVALTVTAMSLLAARSVESALRAYGADARLTVFIDPTSVDDGPLLADEVARAAGEGAKAEFISAAKALARLRAELGESGRALDGLAVNPLPPSIEVRVSSAKLARGDLSEVRFAAERLRKLAFVREVDYGGAFLERLETLLLAVRAAGIALFALVLAIALFLVGNVVRLTVYARRDEIDILRLVGGTDGFIATPFILEGAMQGLVGGVLAGFGALAAERILWPRIASGFGFGEDLLPATSGAPFFLALVAAGGAMGLAASLVAVLRFLRKAK